MSSLPNFPLLKQIMKQDRDSGGAIVQDHPNFDRIDNCGYVVKTDPQKCPTMPWRRDEIIQELKEDDSREARVRRDVQFPDFDAVAQPILTYAPCVAV